jgi:two-component system sensor histidine kinase/response regulator
VKNVLYQQLEQERLLNQVTAQIRQSLDLPVILSTAVEQLRELLQVDRVLIYQFENNQLVTPPPGIGSVEGSLSEPSEQFEPEHPVKILHSALSEFSGQVTYEARSSEKVQSVLHQREQDNCFINVPNCREKYCKGFALAVPDIEATYHSSPCLVEFLRGVQVRAKLVVSIVVKEQLWGLLISHQCFETYQWQEQQIKFVVQITEHLSIAIYQAQLFAQVQQQKHTLEQRVQERTQALQDTLLAAQAANRTKGEFLAAMSHELRTPLTCIIGISATLLRLQSDSLTHQKILQQKQESYLETIHNSGTHLLDLINDILDLSQVEAGKTILQISTFSLTKLAQQSLHLFRDQAQRQDLILKGELQIQPEQDLFTADERRVKQILYNLFSNAIKFTPAKGEVTLRVKVSDNVAVFEVEDTGIGIPQEQQHLLFEKFQQIDASYHRRYGGTGLGLALTKQLVELHGGVIQFKSQVDVGSIFTVYLPAQSLGVVKASKKSVSYTVKTHSSPPNSSEHNPCFVVIEQEESTATLICELLTASGYQVVWLGQGLTAIQQIQLLQPRWIIIDLDLPSQAGYEMIQLLQQNTATETIKVLAMISPQFEKTSLEEWNITVDIFLKKPLKSEVLIDAIIKLEIENELKI